MIITEINELGKFCVIISGVRDNSKRQFKVQVLKDREFQGGDELWI